jgi:hypothetical protein
MISVLSTNSIFFFPEPRWFFLYDNHPGLAAARTLSES